MGKECRKMYSAWWRGQHWRRQRRGLMAAELETKMRRGMRGECRLAVLNAIKLGRFRMDDFVRLVK